MKILLLGEYSNVHATLAKGLRALGHEVLVVSNGDFWKNYPRDIDLSRSSSRLGALAYLLTLGREGIPEAAENAVLNANYMRVKLAEKFTMAYDEICMHEFVMSLVDLHKETGVSALDLAKGMLDFGLHPPTMYFPLIVHEALMVEPCETESKETMDEVCDIYGRLFDLAYSDPDALHTAPHDTPVRRLDEVGAARNMILRYSFAQ